MAEDGGILTEAMAKRGAQATGIDLADKSLQVARLHQLESGVADAREVRSVIAGRRDMHLVAGCLRGASERKTMGDEEPRDVDDIEQAWRLRHDDIQRWR